MNRFGTALLILSLTAVTTACGPSTSPSPAVAQSPPTATASGPASEPASPSTAPPLTIGLLLPFTESAVNNELGVAQKRAAELYVQQHGGMLAGHPVQFAYSDESVDGPLDATKATLLVEQEHAAVILGLIGDEGAAAVRTYVDGKHIVFIDTSASGNALTRATPGCTPSCASRYVFRNSFSNWQLSEPLGEWAGRQGRTSFYTVASDDTFGAESTAAFVEGLGKDGGASTGHSSVASGSDWAKVVDAIKAQPTKDVYAAFAGADAQGFIGAWAAAGMSSAGYGLYGPGLLTDTDVLAAVKDQAAGITTSLFWASSLESPANRALVDLFPKAYQNEDGTAAAVTAYVVEMWDAMTALDQALQSGGTASDSLVSSLEGATVVGARGSFTFDPTTHNVVDDVYIRRVTGTGSAATNAVIDTIPAVTDPGK